MKKLNRKIKEHKKMQKKKESSISEVNFETDRHEVFAPINEAKTRIYDAIKNYAEKKVDAINLFQ